MTFNNKIVSCFINAIKGMAVLLLSIISLAGFGQVTNRIAGSWSNPGTWSDFRVPSDTDIVFLTYDIIVDVNSTCKSLNANEYNVTINPGVIFNITSNTERGSITDIDGNAYKTISIGAQTWMAENLKTTHYNDGTPLPNITDFTEWKNALVGEYCDYNNDTSIVSTYGRLYNWPAASDTIKNICPHGWHIPSDSEWMALITYLGGQRVAGGKMREAGFDHWIPYQYSYTAASNSSGFTILGAGYRNVYISFGNLGHFGIFWSTTEYNQLLAHSIVLGDQDPQIDNFPLDKPDGFSCRCAKD